MTDDPLKTYREKRDFRSTPEPDGKTARKKAKTGKGHADNLYIIQMHDARRLHYDFRLELDGVLKSWAVTKGPSLDPSDKRLAVRTEDHPLDYGGFEGVIPQGYGKGTVMLWDRGSWEPKEDPHEGLEKGALKFTLHGERLTGGFALIRMKNRDGKRGRENWLLVKERDEDADAATDPREEWTVSVKTGRDLGEIAEGGDDYKKGKRYAPDPEAQKPAPESKLTFIKPMLAKLRDEPPEGGEWLHEIKYDGYRIQALIADGGVRLISRNGKDWTERYPDVAEALEKVKAGRAIIDGELVAVDSRGHSDFGALQNATRKKGVSLRYHPFDLLHLDGEDLRGEALEARKAALEKILKGTPKAIHFSDHIEGDGERVIGKACALGLEGIISKKVGSKYRSGRGTSWVKSKCIGSDEFVIVGYRKSDKRGRPFASLLLGEHVDGELVYRGRVGTGFDDDDFGELSSKFASLRRKTSPLADTPGEAKRGAVWLTPKLVAQINYTEQTSDGRLRHPSYLGLREDKPAEEVRAMPKAKRDDKSETEQVGGVRLTSPDRVMFPTQGATKREVAEYYRDVADHILPYLADRPLSLVRCPKGREGQCFFQKHHNASVPEHVDKIMIAEKDGGKSPYLTVDTPEGLIAAAQIGTLELHIWGARADRLERPERLVFDLDPDEAVGFGKVRDAARELRDVLAAAGLESFPLLTGGKGIHVVVPLERRREWPDIKAFASGLAKRLAEAAPDRYLAKSSKAKRKGRIFIDWLRNERGSTAIAPYSLRAREGAPVATPVSWDELSRVDSAAKYNLSNIRTRLSRLEADPWDGYADIRQSITADHLRSVAGDD